MSFTANAESVHRPLEDKHSLFWCVGYSNRLFPKEVLTEESLAVFGLEVAVTRGHV